MAKKTDKKSGGKHTTPRVHVPLPKDVVDRFRAWCEANRRVLSWEIAHLMERFLEEQKGGE